MLHFQGFLHSKQLLGKHLGHAIGTTELLPWFGHTRTLSFFLSLACVHFQRVASAHMCAECSQRWSKEPLTGLTLYPETIRLPLLAANSPDIQRAAVGLVPLEHQPLALPWLVSLPKQLIFTFAADLVINLNFCMCTHVCWELSVLKAGLPTCMCLVPCMLSMLSMLRHAACFCSASREVHRACVAAACIPRCCLLVFNSRGLTNSLPTVCSEQTTYCLF